VVGFYWFDAIYWMDNGQLLTQVERSAALHWRIAHTARRANGLTFYAVSTEDRTINPDLERGRQNPSSRRCPLPDSKQGPPGRGPERPSRKASLCGASKARHGGTITRF
jgi:hypothetical protein